MYIQGASLSFACLAALVPSSVLAETSSENCTRAEDCAQPEGKVSAEDKPIVVRVPLEGQNILGSTTLAGVGVNAHPGGKNSNTKLLFVPVPVVNPTIGTGLAIAGILTFGREERRSTVAAAVGYAKNGSWLAGAGGSLHIANDLIRVSWGAAAGKLKLKYYGIGPDSIFADHPVDFSGSGWVAQLKPTIKVQDSLYVGVLGRYMDATIKAKLPIDVLPALKVPFTIISGGPVAEYDSRDASGWPTSGVHATGQYLFSKETAGVFNSDLKTKSHSFNVAAASYFSLADQLILAVMVRGAGASHNTPFFLKPSVSFRGYSSGERLDDYVLEGQAELRWMFSPKFGVVGFGGLGSTGKSFGALSGLATTVGAGARYRISRVDKMNVGVDVAHSSRGNWSISFGVGEAF